MSFLYSSIIIRKQNNRNISDQRFSIREHDSSQYFLNALLYIESEHNMLNGQAYILTVVMGYIGFKIVNKRMWLIRSDSSLK